ncbi:MAG: FkbM family methyltransferase [Xanthomonadaceae bacterium]|nr:FkbM family methyltransferase [Xanthomonadaceae bacterium]
MKKNIYIKKTKDLVRPFLYGFKYLYHSIVGNQFLAQANKWFLFKGDEKLLLNHRLSKDSLVMDIGGYKGVFIKQILNISPVNVHLFEPIPEYIGVLKDKFKDQSNVIIHQFGLSDHDGRVEFYMNSDGTSEFGKAGNKISVELKKASQFFDSLGIKSIDLFSLNIEGGEYSVLDDLIKSGWLSKIKFMQIQFHQTVPNSNSLRESLIEKIQATHEATFSYPFVWEGFRLRS